MPRTQQRNAPTTEPDQEAPAKPAQPAKPAPGDARPRSAVMWTRQGASQSAIIDGREYRVTKFPADSPLAAPYGAYADGRFIGSGMTLDNVKGRCAAHAGRLRFRRPDARHENDPESST